MQTSSLPSRARGLCTARGCRRSLVTWSSFKPKILGPSSKKTKTFSFLTVVPRTENSISESGIEGARRRCCWDRPAWSPAAWRHGGAAQGGRPVAGPWQAFSTPPPRSGVMSIDTNGQRARAVGQGLRGPSRSPVPPRVR